MSQKFEKCLDYDLFPICLSPRLSDEAFTNEFFTKACEEWRNKLAEGLYNIFTIFEWRSLIINQIFDTSVFLIITIIIAS